MQRRARLLSSLKKRAGVKWELPGVLRSGRFSGRGVAASLVLLSLMAAGSCERVAGSGTGPKARPAGRRPEGVLDAAG
jgi:hypothetical protein